MPTENCQPENTIQVSVVRSNRKTAAICVLKNGDVEARVPIHLSESQVEDFIEKRRERIIAEALYKREVNTKQNAYTLTYGSLMLIRGHRVPIIPLADEEPDIVWLTGDALFIKGGLSDGQLKSSIMGFLVHYARGVFAKKLIRYAELMDVKYIQWDLTDAKKRAASCSNRKKINISWRLIMASDFVIDGVIVHELAHLRHLNHSRDFYAEIEKYLPDYAERRNVMAKEYFTLQCEGWL